MPGLYHGCGGAWETHGRVPTRGDPLYPGADAPPWTAAALRLTRWERRPDEAQEGLAFDGTTQPRVSDHPGVIVGLTSVAPAPVTITRLEAHATLASGDALWLRGNAPSLDWTWGVPAWKVSDGIYRWAGTEIPKGVAFEYEWLRNDEAWQTGANESAAGGDSDVTSPSF